MKTSRESARTAGNFLASRAEAATIVARELAEQGGSMAGRYKLLQRIGEGGMRIMHAGGFDNTARLWEASSKESTVSP